MWAVIWPIISPAAPEYGITFRVPDEYAGLDLRGIVRLSTRIRIPDDPKAIRARKIAARLNAETETYWRSLVDGRSVEVRTRYLEARRRARTMGFDYASVDELLGRPWTDILERLERIVGAKAMEDEATVVALLGGEKEPQLLISELFKRYDAITSASRIDMSPDQIRKGENPKKRAIANLLAVIGDKAIQKVSRNDALDFRVWWQDRVLGDDVEIGTANKDLGHLNRIFSTVEKSDRLGLAPVFGDLRIEGETTASRIPDPSVFVQEKLLVAGVLDSLNEEARAIVYLIVETGMRLSEAANLTAATIVLDADVPHVRLLPDGRRMKTEQSERDIPLVGVSLLASQKFPNGFPRYRDKSAGLSAIVNKVLGNAGLRPGGQTLYSLRHTFEDRLTAVEAPEKLIANLMGHKFARPKYGLGPSLEQKREWLQRISYKAPSRV